MPRQRFEGDMRTLLACMRQTDPASVWFMKIQQNMRSYRSVPGDFIVLTSSYRILLELKECRMPRFQTVRFTQAEALRNFSQMEGNHSLLVVCFWNGKKATSGYYPILITPGGHTQLEGILGKASFKEEDLAEYGGVRYSYDQLFRGILETIETFK